MHLTRPRLSLVLGVAALLLAGCEEGTHAPRSGPEPTVDDLAEEGASLAPLDLVYVCGNKFLLTNSTSGSVHVTYRVAGTRETGSITLPPAPFEDPGRSETEMETRVTGVVELYRNDERLVRRRNQNLPCGPISLPAASAVSSPAEAGSWSPAFHWPVVALHASLLPDGRVLSWGLDGPPYLWDPASGEFTAVGSPTELFCSGHSLLPDGRVLVSGGHLGNDRGLPDISIFSPAEGSWTSSFQMRRGRWYPTNTTLANGAVVILAGSDEASHTVAEPEVWSPSGLRILGSASLALPYYPRTFLAPNGRIYYAGELQQTRYLNTSGNGSWTTAQRRRYGNRSYGAAVMYDVGKIIYVGGGFTTNTAEIIDLNAGSPVWSWTGSMAFARRNFNATVLPTGEVLATGGTTGTTTSDLAGAVLAAEMWNSTTGVWRLMAGNAIRRAYHSTSLLLPDGRVLHAGSGDGANMPDQLNAELYSPPYLAQGERPTLSDAPSRVAYGSTFTVATPDATDIGRVSLIRLGSTTHAFNMEQRFQWLPFVAETGSLQVTAPASGNLAPPGHYMLFILNRNGVPSVARILRLGPGSEPLPPPNTSPIASFIAGCSEFNCTFADRSTDADGNLSSWSWSFGDGDESPTRDPNHVFAAAGTYTVSLTAGDREGATGATTRQVTVPSQQFPIALTLTSRSTATQQHVDLVWSGGHGPAMYIYRNGTVFSSTTNDGRETITRSFTAAATYVFKVCEAATTICSNPATATFRGGATTTNMRPSAIFTATCAAATCRFADGSSDADGSVTAWRWEFGDGQSTTEQNPSHGYTDGGEYTVRLTVTDNRGAQATTTRTVTVSAATNVPPEAGFTASCSAQECSFTDTSHDPDGSIHTRLWDFGDGESSQAQSPSHSYAGDGTYDVSLTVTDNRGAQASTTRQITVSPPGPNTTPAARFGSNCTGLACTFTDASADPDGTVTAWRWDFGDGTSATTRNPSHTYATGGSYTVGLRVTDDRGGEGATSAQVIVTNALPSADFGSSCSGLACVFTDRSTDADGSVVGWQWTFGDGTSSTAPSPSRTYAAPGTYSVTLMVTDNAGGTHRRSVPVTVAEAAGISFSATGRRDATKHYIDMVWSGANGANVDQYRNGVRLGATPNDGRHTIVRTFTGAATYMVWICETVGGRCSSQVTVRIN